MSEVQKVKGEEGNFTVTVKQNPRYVDMDKCIACGLCAEKCPKKVSDEFNEGLSKRKAAYIPYGQSVPLKYALDGENCIYIQKGKCGACEKHCPTGAIKFDDKETLLEVKVGSIIAAPGFKAFDPVSYDMFDFGHNPDVVTSLQYERILSASGPCMGHLQRPSDSVEPKKVAWLQCVGSRNTNQCANGYCSSVCCMYAIKQAIVSAEHASGDLECTIFYMDMRTHGKEFEKYYELAKEKGIKFVRNRIHTAYPKEGGGVLLEYMGDDGKLTREPFDMFVLSVGLETGPEALQLAETLGIELDAYKFAKTTSFEPVATTRPGIYACGCYQGPKDIPQSVTEASSAAFAAVKTLASERGSLTKAKTFPPEKDLAADEPKIGVFVCSCGINIAGTVDVKKVCEYAETLPNVVYVKNNMFSCSADTQALIAQEIKANDLNRIVIAACTPRTHEPLFQETIREAGLNPYLVEMANIRNQNSWVHQKEPEKATEKAIDQVRMAVAKARLLQPLDALSVQVNQTALVVGGGVAGMTVALGLSKQGFDTVLLEKTSTLGGNALALNKTWKGEEISPYVKELAAKVEATKGIRVYKNAALKTCKGSVGDFVSEIDVAGETRAIKYGAAVICTGAKESKPSEYLYGQDDRVFTHLEFDKELREHGPAIAKAGSTVFIQCVGSREPGRMWCSRVCCTHTMESALEVKKANKDMNVVVLYRDIRTYGAREDLFKACRDQGVIFIRYSLDKKPQVTKRGNDLVITVEDHILKQNVEIRADYLVLASAIEPRDNKSLVELYKCGLNADGFLSEAHPKLRPVDMTVDGMFLAGICHYPKPLDETIAQAQAAVARATLILSKSEMTLDSIKSYPTENCDGCALCVDTCPYGAITLIEYRAEDGRTARKIETNKALCKGCGICEATCPKMGVFVSGFTNIQLEAQLGAVLENI
ncbi:MAG: CoB--CoM heterodisulfide reductase iron-sulfur subunit A family protein [Deltaproteobacteria bacterium]|nr:CoB--CoM heterodisulfide reductase iron-sulfur subunit A family protein [Deltaproteobacteria bacterium]